MSIQAKKTVVGAFVAAALVLAVAAVLFLGGGRLFGTGKRFILYFQGSVKGLTEGAPVLFKGVQVGSVKDISLQYHADKEAFCTAVKVETFDRIQILGAEEGNLPGGGPNPEGSGINQAFVDMLVQRGLRAQLGLQSMLTGQLQVELDFHPDTPATLCGGEEGYVELPTIPSPLERFSSTIEKIPLDQIMNELLLTLQGIEDMVNAPATREALDSLNATMKELHGVAAKVNARAEPFGKKLDAAVEELHRLATALNERFVPLAGEMESLLAETRAAVRKAQAKIDPLAEDLSGTLAETRRLVARVDEKVEPLGREFLHTTRTARAVLERADKTLAAFQGLVPEDSALAWQVSTTLESVGRAMDALNDLAEYLRRNPEALLFGRDGR